MSGKIALITGITGQDGSYLTELLLSKGYTVSFSMFNAFIDQARRVEWRGDAVLSRIDEDWIVGAK